MLSIYLFTVVFVSLCLLIAEPEPRNFTFACDPSYEVHDSLDTLHWITNFVAEALPEPESNTITADPKPTNASITEVTAEPELAKTDELDARVKEITEVYYAIGVSNVRN